MINSELNRLAKYHEQKYHNPILKQIINCLKLNCKIKYSSTFDVIVKTDYKFTLLFNNIL